MSAYGVGFKDRQTFAKLLRACSQVEDLERIRFTSPHPKDFTDDMTAAMAETPNIVPQLHIPLQSGSDVVLEAMRRSYRRKRFLGTLERVREAMPCAATATDIIVGFPGETNENFEATINVVREARFSAAYTFRYSKRPGTPAAEMQNQVAHETVQERYERLVELVGRIAWEEGRRFEGQEIEVMFTLGGGRKDSEASRMNGRARDNGLIHVAVGEGPSDRPRPRDIAYATITHAAPHHLNSDVPLKGLRRTRDGDAWEATNTDIPEPKGVPLDMPGLRRP